MWVAKNGKKLHPIGTFGYCRVSSNRELKRINYEYLKKSHNFHTYVIVFLELCFLVISSNTNLLWNLGWSLHTKFNFWKLTRFFEYTWWQRTHWISCDRWTIYCLLFIFIIEKTIWFYRHCRKDHLELAMEEKYIRFYMSFHKAFQGKKSNSLLELNQSLSSRHKQWIKERKLWKD